MFLLSLFAILFSVQCAPHKETSNFNEVVFSQYENLLGKVNTYANYASNFQNVLRDHGRFRRSADDDEDGDDYDTSKPIPIVISKGFSANFRQYIKYFLRRYEAEHDVEFQEIEFNQVNTVDSHLVVIISETKEPLKECFSVRAELGTGNADRLIITFFLNEKCIMERLWSSNTTEAPKGQTRRPVIIYQ